MKLIILSIVVVVALLQIPGSSGAPNIAYGSYNQRASASESESETASSSLVEEVVRPIRVLPVVREVEESHSSAYEREQESSAFTMNTY